MFAIIALHNSKAMLELFKIVSREQREHKKKNRVKKRIHICVSTLKPETYYIKNK